MPALEPIVGRYMSVEIAGSSHRVFFEEAGSGVPLLCLHTAGADSRQYRHLLNDPAITNLYRLEIAGPALGVFFERPGGGFLLLSLHTGGADSRQYRHLLNDPAITNLYRVIAFDMPYHGRSNPPAGWGLRNYRLKTAFFVSPSCGALEES